MKPIERALEEKKVYKYIICPICNEKVYEDTDGDFLCDHDTGDFEYIRNQEIFEEVE
jgi:hypothetical protein